MMLVKQLVMARISNLNCTEDCRVVGIPVPVKCIGWLDLVIGSE